MKPIVEFVDELSQLGIKLWEEDGYLAYDMPKGVLTPTLRAELVARKTEILEVLRQTKQATVGAAKDGSSLPFPLSYGQQALWFIYQQAPQSPAYNMALPLEFRGDLNVTVLQTVLSQLVRRHPMLRTTITVENDQPLQTVHASANLTGLADLSGLESPPPMGYAWTLREATAWDEEMLLAQMHLDYEQPFELSQGPVLRAVLYRCTSQRHLLLLTMHHIFGDASSFGIFLEELLALYTGELAGHSVTLPPLPTSYADYIRWENDLLKGADGTRLATYWQTQLAGEIPVLNLPTDRPRPPIQTFNGASHNFSLTPELSQQLKTLAQMERTTLFTVLLAAFQVLLHRYTGQTEIWVGTPTAAGRQPLEFTKLVGYLVNPVVLRATFDSPTDLTVRQILAQTQQTVLNALDHQSYPFPLLVKQLQPHRDLSHAPLFQVMFDFQSTRLFQAPNSVMVAVLDLAQMDGQFDLTLTITEGESLTGAFRYNADLFDSRTLARLTEHFQILLAGLVSNPAPAISQLPLLTEAEQAQLIAWNQTQTDYPTDQTIVDIFEAQVTKTPENVAVVFEDQHLTYQQLNAKANQLAHYLMSLGVTAETLVGICVERSFAMVIGVLGILKAGGAYVPLDPAYPQERLRFMLEDSQVPVLLTQPQLGLGFLNMEGLGNLDLQVVNLDRDWEPIARGSEANPERQSGPANLAYVIYTSGSTGQPKGVMIEHLGLTNLSQALVQQVAIQANSQCLQLVSLSFDVATADLAMTLAVGATLHLLPNSSRSVGEPLFAQLQEKQITHLQIPVAVLATLTKAPLPTLQVLMVGGEACPSELVTHWSPGRKFINAYGPTETTVCATLTECLPNGKSPPIGKPVANTQIYILDAYHHPTPLGIPGELCIAGVGLARGYLNRPDLTAEKFVELELFGQRQRVYKTGDLARWLPDGNLEYLGRLDHQIKLRGFRIELGEIEAVLTQHEAVKEAVVVLREQDTNPNLAAYVTLITPNLTGLQDLSGFPTVLRAWLKTRLPDYMIPASFTVLEKLPLSPNGKIDRQALPEPDSTAVASSSKCVPPQTPTEQKLAQLWAEVLGLEQIGREDNFFELGGHSLLALQLVSKIAIAMDVELSVKFLFLHPTIAQQAVALPNQTPSSDSSPAMMEVPKSSWQGSPFLKQEPRPLLSLFATGEIPPVDAAALGYLPSSMSSLLSNIPILDSILETPWGRIATIILPILDTQLYEDQKRLIMDVVKALKMAKLLGAKTVSLTGLLPSATNYGRLVLTEMTGNESHLPSVSTGHATTGAAVVLNIRRLLEDGGRDLSGERVAFLGVGSIGLTSLRLMLTQLPHPPQIMLCDVYHKRQVLEQVQAELVRILKFQGEVVLAPTSGEVPEKIYEATLIVGATNVPEVLDITQVRPGTLVIDDSAPHCFSPTLAIQRFQEKTDILFTEGGVLQSPEPFHQILHSTPEWDQWLDSWLFDPQNITGCVFSSLLSARFELPSTLGPVAATQANEHYHKLTALGFQGSQLHCENYRLPLHLIEQFRTCFGQK